MKMYDPEKNDSFVMQFGFRCPNWQPKTQNNYVKIADRKNDRRKSSSNISKLNE